MSANQILDLSTFPTRLSTRNYQLVLEPEGLPTTSVPLVDLSAVIIAHPQVRITSGALSQLADAGCPVIVCDRANVPAGMYLPLVGHGRQTPRFRAQASASIPLRKRLWRELVRHKILAQADALTDLRGSDFGLRALIGEVKSGDTSNVEARAARRYWRHLFGEPFHRNHQAEDANRFLNYGYAVLRAIVARAICGAGLHPTLGIHHHNQGNAFCLADDLMEPFRPLVDRVVVEVVEQRGGNVPLDTAVKRDLLGSLTGRIQLAGEQRTVFEAAERLAVSLCESYLRKRNKLVIPQSLKPIPF